MRELSRRHLTGGGSREFWEAHADEAAQTILKASGMMSSIVLIYSVYRHYRPELPSLAQIYAQPELIQMIDGPFNGAIRVFDDFGDRQVDTGLDSQWGVFNLNLFNQPNAKFLGGFIEHSGIEDENQRRFLMESFNHTDLPGRMQVVKAYIRLLRAKIKNLPKPLWEKYAVFLNLCKRTLEAGLVNIVGDVVLAADNSSHMIEPEILKLLAGYVETGTLA